MPLVVQPIPPPQMSTTANMSLNELHALQKQWKKEDEELQWRMEEAEEQEAERRCEEERAEAEQNAAEAEEVRRAKVGTKRKAVGTVDEDGSEAPEGFAQGEPCYLCQKVEVVCYWPDGYVFLLLSSNLVNTCYRSSSTKARSCYCCKELKKPCGMEVPKKKAKKMKTEASGVVEKSGAAKMSRATGGAAERSRSAAMDRMAELTRAAWTIARTLGGIWAGGS